MSSVSRSGPAPRPASASRRPPIAPTSGECGGQPDHNGSSRRRLRSPRRARPPREPSRCARRGGGHVLLGTVLSVWAWRTAGRLQPRAVSGGAVVQRTLTRLTFGSGLQTDVLLSMAQLAACLQVHPRTLRAAARHGRLAVTYDTRSAFGRPVPRATVAAGEAFKRLHYRRTTRWTPPVVGPTWSVVPENYDAQLVGLRMRLG
jgi:hypothetical protein